MAVKRIWFPNKPYFGILDNDRFQIGIGYPGFRRWRRLAYLNAPSSGWNKIAFASEPPVPGAWNKVKYDTD